MGRDSIMPKVNRYGRCPYCDNSSFSFIEQNRPDREIMKCDEVSCLKYFVKHSNGNNYPLVDPFDQNSFPSIKTL